MADQNSNIDLVFRNGLKEFEILPPQEVWDSIAPSIARKRPATYLRAAAFIGLTITAGAGTYFLSQTIAGKFPGPAITLNQDSRPEGKYIPYVAPLRSGIAVTQNIAQSIQVPPGVEIESSGPSISTDLTGYGTLTFTGMKGTSFASQKNRPFLNYRGILYSSGIPNKNDATLNYNVGENETPSLKMNRWILGASASPTYYSKFDAGNTDMSKAWVVPKRLPCRTQEGFLSLIE